MKILACPIQAAGHMNAVIGLCQALKERNHQIYFVIDQGNVGKIKKYGFEEVVLQSASKENDGIDLKTQNPVKYFAQLMKSMGLLSNLSPIEKYKSLMRNNQLSQEMVQKCIEEEPQIREVIEKVQPDLVLVDNTWILPCILHGKAPWVYIWSVQPLITYQSQKLPPFGSGLPTNSDKDAFVEFFAIQDEWAVQTLETQNKLLAHFGYPPMESKSKLVQLSPYLNIYGYPEELDYHEIVPRPEKVVQIDTFSRYNPEPYEMPEKLKEKIKPGDKLVYISMGSMGSIDIDLMKRITGALKNTPHKYIVSKGPLGEEYDLPENMWGEGYLPQTSILPLVDLVITHGGNNSTTETICAGKPMIVMPLFADQFDNAQRVQEKGLGVRIEPYQFEPRQLVKAVDQLLRDDATQLKAKQVAERIAKANSKQRACVALEELVRTHSKQ